MFAPRSVLRGPGALARTQRTARHRNSLSLRSSLQLEALEQRQLLTATVIAVDTPADTVDPLDGLTSLREAVIQANASPDDHEIQLPAGTYALTRQGANEDAALTGDLDILNNGSLKIVGASAETTIIDAAGLFDAELGYGDRIFDVHAGAVVEMEGLTLTGGSTPTSGSNSNQNGGAIRSVGNLTLHVSALSHNLAQLNGGGLFNDATGVLTVSGSTFTNNSSGRDGGAIYTRGEATISDSEISNNSAARDGGALYTIATTAIVASEISDNTAQNGGGIYANSQFQANFSLSRSTISGNVATDRGAGGIFNNGWMNITDSTVSGNHTDGEGGGILNWLETAEVDSRLIVTNSTISNNSAAKGGGISNYWKIRIESSTIALNTASIFAGGVFASGAILVPDELVNTIVAGNSSSNSPDWGGRTIDSSSSFNLIGDPNSAGSLIHGVNGNIVGDGLGNPLDISTVLDTMLADNGGPTLTHALVLDSPAINAGGPLFNPDGPLLYDQRGPGFERVKLGRVDIGAFEGVPDPAPVGGIIQVSTFVDIVDDDGLWSLREAVIYANDHSGDFEIRLPAGTYALSRQGAGEDGALTGDLDVLNNGSLRIVGTSAETTIIDASELYNPGLGYGDRVFDVQDGAVVEIEDLTLSGSRMRLSGIGSDFGGAVRNNGNLIILSTRLSSNTASSGAAIYNLGELTVASSFISGNSGSGIHNAGQATINSSSVSGNIGGGIFNHDSGILTVNASSLNGNSSDQGGGIYSRGSATVQVSTLSSNLARHGGAIYATGPLVVVDSEISGNEASGGGGGIFTDPTEYGGAQPPLYSIARSIISNNRSTGPHSGGGINNSGVMVIRESTISGNQSVFNGGGVWNRIAGRVGFEASLLIVASTISENSAPTGGGLVSTAPLTIADSTISGNVANAGGGIRTSSDTTFITNSTISGNSGGGILHQGRVMTIEHSTITDNTAGGVQADGFRGQYLLLNTIVAGNTGPSLGDWNGKPLDPTSSFNLIGDPDSAGGLTHGANGNIVGDGLGNPLDVSTVIDTTLADNGGPTLTHALVPGSPAVNAGDPLFDPNATDPPTLYDQRGPGFDRVKFGRLDIGAFEGVPDPAPVGGVIVVSTFDDVVGDDGLWSLREAVIYTNAHPEDNEIHLPAGTYTLTRQGANEDAALTGDLDILNNGSLKIVGASAETTIIDASGLFDAGLGYGDHIFDIKGNAVAVIDGLTLTGGSTGTGSAFLSGGGAIYNAGDLKVTSSNLSGNSTGSSGGGIWNRGALTVIDSTFSGNSARNGGAIWDRAFGLDVVISGSTFTGNSATENGAAIHFSGTSQKITDSSFSGNITGHGAIYSEGSQMTISGSLVTQNQVGIALGLGNMTIADSTISENTGRGISTGPSLLTDSLIITGSKPEKSCGAPNSPPEVRPRR